MRLLQLAIVTAVATAFVATASVAGGPACESGKTTTASAGAGCCAAKAANATHASSGGNCSAMAAAGMCGTASASTGGHCAWSQAAMARGGDCQKVCEQAMASLAAMEPFKFLNDVKADQVHTMVQTTDNGIAFVFAAVKDADVAAAKQAAQASVTTLSKPANCDMSRCTMAKDAAHCTGTEACVKAMAGAEIKVVDNERGATTLVVVKDEAKVKELHAFLMSLPAPEPASKS